MTVSTTTFQRWKKQLAINQQLLNSEGDRFRWLRKVYVQIYQFLVNQYGDKVRSSDHDGAESSASSMPFEDLTLDHRGLQPRTGESMQNVLKVIHSNQPAGHPTTQQSIFKSTTGDETTAAWIIVSTNKEFRIWSCEKVLQELGITFRRRRDGRRIVLEVPFSQRDAGLKALLDPSPRLFSLRLTKQDRIDSRKRIEFWYGVCALVACVLLALAVGLFNNLPHPPVTP